VAPGPTLAIVEILDMNKNVILALVLLVLVAALWVGLRNRGGGAVTAPVEVEGLDDQQTLVRMAQGISRGPDDAPVTILEFADFQCPACRGFMSSVKPQVEMAWVDGGQARFVYYDFPLTTIHPHAFLASRAGRCAEEQDLFWPYHDALYQNQASWSPSPSPPVSEFVRYAAQVGLDQSRFSQCLRSDRYADVVTANMRLGEALGVRATPTVMVNGGGMTQRPENSMESIQAAVEAILAAGAGAGAGEGSP
jgi:protein-disulfide isomerase